MDDQPEIEPLSSREIGIRVRNILIKGVYDSGCVAVFSTGISPFFPDLSAAIAAIAAHPVLLMPGFGFVVAGRWFILERLVRYEQERMRERLRQETRELIGSDRDTPKPRRRRRGRWRW